MEKNELFTAEITDMTSEGEGIGHVGEFTLFIKDALIGDVIEGKVIKVKKTYGYGKLLKVVTPSKSRTEARCEKARACGGCQIQEMDYAAQLRFKHKKVSENLRRIGGISCPVEPCLGMQSPWRYRNKAQVPFGYDREGTLKAGFYAGHTHDIIDMEDCVLTPECVADVIRAVKSWMLRYGVRAYEEEKGSGLIRHVLVRKGFHTGEVMVCLIARSARIPFRDELLKCLQEIDFASRGEKLTSVCLNINEKPGNTILGPETLTLSGQSYIEDTIGSVRFRISPNSFFQVNPEMTQVLYGKALEFAGLSGQETVWDLYCGIGTISLFLAQKAKKVYGVEIVPQAIEDAKQNAELNGLENTEFFTGKAEEVLPSWYAAHPEEKIDVICVDPPRKGCDPACLDTMVRMAPEKIVYVSCDSATLARDLKYLSENGYQVEKVQPVDQFGHTCHVETVVLLSGEKSTATSI